MRSPRTATKSSPRSPQPEKARQQQRRPNAAKNIKTKTKTKNSESSTKEPGAAQQENRNLTAELLDKFGLGGHSGSVGNHTPRWKLQCLRQAVTRPKFLGGRQNRYQARSRCPMHTEANAMATAFEKRRSFILRLTSKETGGVAQISLLVG